MTPEAMAFLHARAFEFPRSWSAKEIATLLGAEGALVATAPEGFALGRAIAGEVEILTIAVLPEARGRGVGAGLLSGILERARLSGATRAVLETAASNEPALALYRAAGFEQAGRRAGYYLRTDGRRDDAVLLEKDLARRPSMASAAGRSPAVRRAVDRPSRSEDKRATPPGRSVRISCRADHGAAAQSKRETTMNQVQKILAAAATAAVAAGTAAAEPGLIIDLGGKFDKSFNESAWNGAQRWVNETGGDYIETELQSEAQREQNMRKMAERGANPIVVLGFANASTLEKVAPDYPETNFAIVDMVVEAPNVKSIIYSEHEGSYLVGLIAGMKSAEGSVGFVGGMDVPLIRKFACGYAQGVMAADPDATVIANMTGTTPAAWNDPVKGGELAKAQIDQGADVIYAAAGGTGIGVLQAAADRGVFSIGVDSNQNYLHPGSVLTSMLKRVDNTVYKIFAEAEAGEFQPGITVLGVATGDVDYAVDEHNESEIGEDIRAAVEKAKDEIVSGDIYVHDYTSDDSCPVLSF